MTVVLNRQTFLLAAGILQPTGAADVLNYLAAALQDQSILPDVEAVHALLMNETRNGLMLRVTRNPDLFSLTERGNQALTRRHRQARDKLRLYLLKDARALKLRLSRGANADGSGGVPPSLDQRLAIKGAAANMIGRSVPPGQSYWPLLSMQFSEETGASQVPRDIPALPLLSFASRKQLAIALGYEDLPLPMDYRSLGLMLGVSPRLISQIAYSPERHYRSFVIKKKSGGERNIESPRTFLKVIQYFLNDYIMCGLPVSDRVFSYRRGIGISENAAIHIGQNYVGNIDIKDFFGSITRDSLRHFLESNGFDPTLAEIASRITTKDEKLPQGAPSSPALSNSYLHKFDDKFAVECEHRGLKYSRYADDITISGASQVRIREAIGVAADMLDKYYGFKLNVDKTRIASAEQQQRVTGLIVNEGVRPPRIWRRKVRAEFHNAEILGVVDRKTFNRLSGCLSYLTGFESLHDSGEIKSYRKTLSRLVIEAGDVSV